jgi:hypothetical protein
MSAAAAALKKLLDDVTWYNAAGTESLYAAIERSAIAYGDAREAEAAPMLAAIRARIARHDSSNPVREDIERILAGEVVT